MTYEEQLNSLEWKNKREEILKRDGYRCQKCLNRSLIQKYRISLNGIGTYSNETVIYSIYDKDSKNSYRCKTQYNSSFINELKIMAGVSNSVIALTVGKGDFSNLISTIILPEKLDYANLNACEKQIKQEKYLKFISNEIFEKIKWIDTKGLHIHHKYYQINKLAWEYPDDALQTLCWECHELLHKNTKISIIDEYGIYFDQKNVCSRCYGAGWFPEFGHVQGGICFKCNGLRFG